MTDLWNYLKETDKPIVLYGTGNGADKIIARLQADGTWDKVQGIFASPGFVRNRSFYGFKVESYEAIRERLGDMIILLCFGSSLKEVTDFVYRIMNDGGNELYAPAVPVYGDGVFDIKYYEAHRKEIDEARGLMADELSLKTFDNTVMYYLTGDIRLLAECEVSTADVHDLLSPPTGSLYLDLGAYNGDTVNEFMSYHPGISEVIAVEPDIKNYRKLCENTAVLSNVTSVNALISDTSGVTHINMGKGRGVHEQSEGFGVRTATVDEIIGSRRCGIIKYDVEGNERKALLGSSATLSGCAPSLLVACYHRSCDIYDLPLLIRSLQSSYNIYLRHRPHLLNWDTDIIAKM
ncbi:methyltransferase, FkbM family [Ruminococcaceae bacterium YRB3002]|nr:methyltransferase, FkbM family [Ruminococcaceae bacterium YRB3002]